MIIRQMQPEDVEAVALLEKNCFSMPWSENSFREILSIPYRFLILAIDDGKVVGECMLTDIAGEGEITNVAVMEQYRKKGIAQQMLEAILEEGKRRSIEAYTLEVRKSNVNAISLYEKFGFQTEGIRKNFYEKPTEDGLIMWKRE